MGLISFLQIWLTYCYLGYCIRSYLCLYSLCQLFFTLLSKDIQLGLLLLFLLAQRPFITTPFTSRSPAGWPAHGLPTPLPCLHCPPPQLQPPVECLPRASQSQLRCHLLRTRLCLLPALPAGLNLLCPSPSSWWPPQSFEQVPGTSFVYSSGSLTSWGLSVGRVVVFFVFVLPPHGLPG